MAKILSKSGISALQVVKPGHITQSINAFTGIEAYDISLSGSFNTTGSLNVKGSSNFTDGSITASVSVGIGSSVNPQGTRAFSHGTGSSATGNFSFSQGRGTNASGFAAHAEGFSTTALGAYSHAEGRNTFSTGSYSHAQGRLTTASGDYSNAGGYGTIASGNYQLVAGQFNTPNPTDNSSFIIGNGSDTNNRSNILFAGNGKIELNAPITASSNISSSGTVFGITGSFSHLQGNSPITVGDQITFQQPITASGAISSSGTITMLTASIGGGIFTSASLAASSGGGGSTPTLQQVTDQGSNTTTPISASIVSASNTVFGITGSFSHLVGNSPINVGSGLILQQSLTSSAELSSSGNFYANRFEAAGYIATPLISNTSTIKINNDLSGSTVVTSSFNFGKFEQATITNTTLEDSLLITTTENSSTAGPVITLKRNSATPDDADYLGQLKFKGENDNEQEVVYAKITGKISDASDTTEDGLIEYALQKAGSNVIVSRLTSTDLKLINGTGLEVNGNISTDGTSSAANVSSSGDISGFDLNLFGGDIDLKNAGAQSNIKFYCESSNAHYTKLQAAPHAAYSGNPTATLPAYDFNFAQPYFQTSITASNNISASGTFIGDGSTLTNLQRPISNSIITHFTASNLNSGFYFRAGGSVTCSIQSGSIVSCDIGNEFEIFQTSSAGYVLFATGSGVTLNSKSGNQKLAGQFSGATLKKVGTDEWDLIGDLG